jgi:hypothetical protein
MFVRLRYDSVYFSSQWFPLQFRSKFFPFQQQFVSKVYSESTKRRIHHPKISPIVPPKAIRTEDVVKNPPVPASSFSTLAALLNSTPASSQILSNSGITFSSSPSVVQNPINFKNFTPNEKEKEREVVTSLLKLEESPSGSPYASEFQLLRDWEEIEKAIMAAREKQGDGSTHILDLLRALTLHGKINCYSF